MNMRSAITRRRPAPRRGIILLVVLGMLTLFSLLAVTYLVLSSRNRSAAAAISQRQAAELDRGRIVDNTIRQLLRGDDGPNSAIWGHDILGDYYGQRDWIRAKVVDARIRGGRSSDGYVDEHSVPIALLGKPPVNNAAASGNLVYGQDAGYSGQEFVGDQDTNRRPRWLRFPTGLFDSSQYSFPGQDVDDALTGRVLTFLSGPLEGLSFRIVRYFGDHESASEGERSLTGQVVIDCEPYLDRLIEIEGYEKTLAEWLRAMAQDIPAAMRTPAVLVYGKGDDGEWGFRGNAAGAVGTDDVGHSFLVNGRPINGPGYGWTGPGGVYNLNEVVSAGSGFDVPVGYQGFYGLYRNDLPDGDADEAFDVPDYNDYWLGHFPDDPQAGAVAPSFVRPDLVNYLINEGQASLASLDADELKSILRLLQRSTMRPLPIQNSGNDPNSSIAVQRNGWGGFTGTNMGGLADPINFNSNDTNQLAAGILRLANGLINGPWDVDNDGDGQTDSVWVDVGLPEVTMADGTRVKPMAAVRIEDLGGRLDLNAVGSLAYFNTDYWQGTSSQTTLGPARAIPGTLGTLVPDNPTDQQVGGAPRGLGYGPADLSLRTLLPTTGRDIIARRYGGDDVPGYASSPVTGTQNDFIGLFRNPERDDIHRLRVQRDNMNNPWLLSTYGLPLDAWGRGTVSLDLLGQPMAAWTTERIALGNRTGGEAVNDPYETYTVADPVRGFPVDWTKPDRAYSLTELEQILRRYDWDIDPAAGDLLSLVNMEDADNDGSAPSSMVNRILRNLTTHSSSQATPPGVLSREWRDGAVAANTNDPLVPLSQVFLEMGGGTGQQTELWNLLPFELRTGGRFNLNRPFGNGLDDNDNRVVDEPHETLLGMRGDDEDDDGDVDEPDEREFDFEPLFDPADQDTALRTPSFPEDPNSGMLKMVSMPGDFTPQQAGFDARALYMRHLYTMAMMMTVDASDGGNPDRFLFPAMDVSLNADQEREFTARQIAQWAANVVDFRDSDAIMTRFVYDPDPLDGWGVDLNDPSTYDVVWGMEAPELVLTESLAFHNRRVKDTDKDDGDGKTRLGSDDDWMTNESEGGDDGDADLDQYQIPQGSLFLELYCTRSAQPFDASLTGRSAQPMAPPSELYHSFGDGETALDLAREAPDGNPVWRVAISRSHSANDQHGREEEDPLKVLREPDPDPLWGDDVPRNRDTITFQPERRDSLQNPTGDYQFDRVIWFTGRNPDADGDGAADVPLPDDTRGPESVYYNRFAGNGAYLRGGQYAVIGPRRRTHVGSRVHSDPSTMTWGEFNSLQRIDLDLTQVRTLGIEMRPYGPDGDPSRMRTPIYDHQGNDYQGQIRPVVGVLAAANPPVASWADPDNTAPTGIGINISEPIPRSAALGGGENGHNPAERYYTEPTQSLNSADANFPIDSYYDYAAAAAGEEDPGQFPDEPFDGRSFAPLEWDFPGTGQTTGTRPQYKTAYLQRLANPLLPYDADTNPYITVDWMSLDLTVFNGSEDNADKVPDTNDEEEWLDPSDPDPFDQLDEALVELPEHFASRYKHGRGLRDTAGVAEPPLPALTNVLWSYGTQPPAQTQRLGGAGDHYFNVQLNVATDINDGGDSTVHSTTLGYLNHAFGLRFEQDLEDDEPEDRLEKRWFIGAPAQRSFPWVAWMNRPFASPIELMLVPRTSAARLSLEYSTPKFDAYDPQNHAYNAPVGSPPLNDFYDGERGDNQDDAWKANLRGEFGHLMNFFASGPGIDDSPNLYRLLDWVEVPDPYDYARFMIPPTTFPGSPGNTPEASWPPVSVVDWNYKVPIEPYRPPFNWITKPTRQGLVNLNSLHDRLSFRELMQGVSNSSDLDPLYHADDDTQTAGGALWLEYHNSRRGYEIEAVTPNNPNAFPIRRHESVHPDLPTQFAGAFKPHAAADIAPQIRGNGAADQDHLRRDPVDAGFLRRSPDGTELPMFALQGTSVGVDADENALHRYLGVTRLANLGTHQSNVFAVWTTVGFFEVDSNAEVGQEYGYSQGETERIRAFFIIDRSIPVAYEPGEDHNVTDTILLQRILN